MQPGDVRPHLAAGDRAEPLKRITGVEVVRRGVLDGQQDTAAALLTTTQHRLPVDLEEQRVGELLHIEQPVEAWPRPRCENTGGWICRET